MLGYLRGYTSAAQFRALGCNTWNANANDNETWLNNPYRKGKDDMGDCYGAQARRFHDRDGRTFDQLQKIVDDLSQSKDDRREIMTFWNPAEINRACLASCMHTHTFSVVHDRLYLTSYQRSADLALGTPYNQLQVAWLLCVMAQITGLRAAQAFHQLVNVHLYDDQLEVMKNEQLWRKPLDPPTLSINPDIKTLKDLETWVTVDDFNLDNYQHHPPIKYPFSV
jgi:thymidylate synthase